MTQSNAPEPPVPVQLPEATFEPVQLTINALGLHLYLGGPWEQLAIYKFRGV